MSSEVINFDDRANSFLQVGTVAKIIAEKHCGVTIDDLTHQRWRETLGILREVDTYVDDTHISAEQALDTLADFSLFSDRYPSLTPDSIGEHIHAAMQARVRRILKLGQYMAQTQSMPLFIALRIKEGRETAGFLADTATATVREQPAFTEKYLPVMESMAITANLLDSIIDGRMDQEDGKMAHPANSEYYRALLSRAFHYAEPGARALLHGSVLKEFAIMSVHRLQNRLTHRGSNTSSTRIFKR